MGEKALNDIYENLDEHLADPSMVLVKKKGINVRNAGRRSKEKNSKKPEVENESSKQQTGPKSQRQPRTSKDQIPHNEEAS